MTNVPDDYPGRSDMHLAGPKGSCKKATDGVGPWKYKCCCFFDDHNVLLGGFSASSGGACKEDARAPEEWFWVGGVPIPYRYGEQKFFFGNMQNSFFARFGMEQVALSVDGWPLCYRSRSLILMSYVVASTCSCTQKIVVCP